MSRALSGEHTWRDSIAVVLLVGGGYLLISFFWRVHVEHLVGWEVPGDIWSMVRQAQYVESGAIAYVYDVRGQFALPLFPVVLAPVVAIGDHFHLIIGYPAPIYRPSMWPLVGPFCVALGVLPMVALRRLASLRTAYRPLLLGVVVGLVVLAPTYDFGHYEDLLALGCVAIAARRMETDSSSASSALWFGCAIAFKQWAVLALPLLLGRAQPSRRLRFLGLAGALPGGLGVVLLLADFKAASAALFKSPSFAGSHLGHVTPLISAAPHVVSTVPFRAVTFAAAAAIGAVAWKRQSPLSASLTLVFLARGLLEPVLYAYYLSPGLGLAVVHAWGTRLRWVVAASASFAIWWSFITTVPRITWALVVTVAIAFAAVPAASALWSSPDDLGGVECPTVSTA